MADLVKKRGVSAVKLRHFRLT